MKHFFYIFNIICRSMKIMLYILFAISVSVESRAMDNDRSAAQSIVLEVKPIARLTVNGNPGQLLIADATYDSGFLSASDANTTYSLVTNIDNMKIIASINDNMPEGTKLLMRLSSEKANSLGLVDVSTAGAAFEIVNGIEKGRELNQTICYVFTAEPDVVEIQPQIRLITLTLTN